MHVNTDWIQSHRYSDTERQFTDTLYQKGTRGRRGPNRATYESSLSSEVIILQISWLATVTMLTTPKTNEERRMRYPLFVEKMVPIVV